MRMAIKTPPFAVFCFWICWKIFLNLQCKEENESIEYYYDDVPVYYYP